MARRLLHLNGLAILGVILNHSVSWVFIAMFWWTDRYQPVIVPNFNQLGGFSYYVLRVIEQSVDFSVPAFLFVSGFFVAFAAGRSESAVAWRIVVRRSKTLVIPYLIWSMLIFVSWWFLEGKVYTISEYLIMLIFGRATPAYYFIPLLIQLYLLSPFIFLPVARKNWKILIIVATIIQFGIQLMEYIPIVNPEFSYFNQIRYEFPNVFFPSKMLWYVLGIVIALHLSQFGPWVSKNKWKLAIGTVILLPLGVLEWEFILNRYPGDWLQYNDTALDGIYALFFILGFLAFGNIKMPVSTYLADLGAKSFGIYLVHSPVLEYVSRIIYHVAPVILAYQLLLYMPILILSGLGIPLLLMVLVKRSSARALYPYLFG